MEKDKKNLNTDRQDSGSGISRFDKCESKDKAFQPLRKAKEVKKFYQKPVAIKDLEMLALQYMIDKHPNTPIHYFSKPSYKDNDTNSLTRCVLDHIRFNGGQAERINTTGRPIDRRTFVVDVCGRNRNVGSIQWIPGNTTTGSADISATICGHSVKIEIKCSATGDRYQSEAQKEYERSIIEAGGFYYIARDFTSFLGWYKQTFE